MWHPRATGETAYPIEETLERMAQSVESGPHLYTPTLTALPTNPDLGTGSASGWWYQVGRRVTGGAMFRFGASGVSPGDGNYAISLPVAADTSLLTASTSAAQGSPIGSAIVFDAVGGQSDPGVIWLGTATEVRILVPAGVVQDDTPMVWAANDLLSVEFSYVTTA